MTVVGGSLSVAALFGADKARGVQEVAPYKGIANNVPQTVGADLWTARDVNTPNESARKRLPCAKGAGARSATEGLFGANISRAVEDVSPYGYKLNFELKLQS